ITSYISIYYMQIYNAEGRYKSLNCSTLVLSVIYFLGKRKLFLLEFPPSMHFYVDSRLYVEKYIRDVGKTYNSLKKPKEKVIYSLSHRVLFGKSLKGAICVNFS
ncbi:MAG: hypothetical protein ACFFDI_03785, partial [Promethearchaeota archaeon]